MCGFYYLPKVFVSSLSLTQCCPVEKITGKDNFIPNMSAEDIKKCVVMEFFSINKLFQDYLKKKFKIL